MIVINIDIADQEHRPMAFSSHESVWFLMIGTWLPQLTQLAAYVRLWDGFIPAAPLTSVVPCL